MDAAIIKSKIMLLNNHIPPGKDLFGNQVQYKILDHQGNFEWHLFYEDALLAAKAHWEHLCNEFVEDAQAFLMDKTTDDVEPAEPWVHIIRVEGDQETVIRKFFMNS